MATRPLLKALADAGLGPRRALADAIRQKRVRVNGAVAEDFRLPVNLESDRVSLDGRPADLTPGSPVYLLLNKPRGVMSTTSDERGRTTVLDLLPPGYRGGRLFPVGRLDRDSTGLMLLTNDGELTHRLTHPSFEHEKEYVVELESGLTGREKARLEQGIELDEGMTRPAAVRDLDASRFRYSITIHEGRKRQVRRMFEHVGHRALALQRVRMGSLRLGHLKEGEVRLLSTEEVTALLSQTVRRAQGPGHGEP